MTHPIDAAFRGVGGALLLALLAAAPAAAQPAAAAQPDSQPAPLATQTVAPLSTTLDPAQARQLLGVLQDVQQRQALLDQLRILAASPAVPAGAAATAPAAALAPAARSAAAPAKAAASPAKATLVPGSLGEQLVGQSAGLVQTLSQEVAATTRAVTGFPAIVRWLRRAAVDPSVRLRIIDAAAKSAVILGLALLAHLALRRLLRRFMQVLDRAGAENGRAGRREAEPDETVLSEGHPRVRAARSVRLLRRLPLAILRAVLAFLPALAFLAAGEVLLGSGLVELFTTKMIVIQALTAFVWYWGVICVGRLLFTDRIARWRLLDPGDDVAHYLDPWLRWLTAVAIAGALLANIGGRLGLTVAAQDGIIKLAALVVHIGLVAIVWRSRRRVARKLHARAGSSAVWATLANQFADRWHWIASVAIMALWLVWAVQVENGLQNVLRLTGITVLVLVGFRVASIAVVGLLDRMFRAANAEALSRPGFGQRALRYHSALRQLVSALIGLAALVALLEAWGVNALLWFSAGAIGARLLSTLVSVVAVIVVALVAWELANATIDRHLHRLSSAGLAAQAGRLRTLAPLLRTCLLSAILIFVVLTALSEIGVNIAPLLAGAGIFGVALGFGSQKLVQDFITGIFLLLENAMQVGEWVTVSGLSGTVETLSVRTLRLRAGDGSVHVIPFSSVTTVTNTNRGIGNAAVSVIVSSAEDTDAVGACLKQIASEMRADPDFARGIRSDLALWGVDRVDASTVTIVGQIECTDGARWGVQREFNRRVKKRFQDLGIRLANPAQAVLLSDVTERRPDRLAAAPADEPAPRDAGDGPATLTRSPPPAALGNTQ